MDDRASGQPVGAAHFTVDVDGREVGCSAVTGLGFESRDQRVTPVTLRLAAGSDPALWTWAREPTPRTVTITLLDLRREPLARYVLRGAHPERWTGPVLDALSGEVALEELVLSAEALDIERVGPASR